MALRIGHGCPVCTRGVKETLGTEYDMLISQQPESGARERQGRREVNLSQLRERLTNRGGLNVRFRQRLLELETRLSRVKALGNEYAQVSFSSEASEALERCE